MSWSLSLTIPGGTPKAEKALLVGAAFDKAAAHMEAPEQELVRSVGLAATAAACALSWPERPITVQSSGHMNNGQGNANLDVRNSS